MVPDPIRDQQLSSGNGHSQPEVAVAVLSSPIVQAPAPDDARQRRSDLLVKRALDIGLALLLLIVLSPVLLFLASLVWLEAGRPVFYRARRLGRDGRVFTMYKLRTMTNGAEHRLADLAHLNLGEGMVKIPHDPRVTRSGAVLRKFSLDELPQLWNVLRGEMSLVGPRPHEPADINATDDVHQVRMRMRPGITGLWQVTARCDPALDVRVYYDLVYISRWSPWLDLKILGRTIPVVLSGRGSDVHIPTGELPGERPDAVSWLAGSHRLAGG